ncbi:ThiF family adenylyltransferase [Bdellovibrio sp. HCB337]|uniref:tRNA threonylcarbamoyladenosine dehydratase n=1 Tax=Bdellovibrio sp. HCB337 TaxID=3394358 RepID=UPI0039A6C6AA
MMETNTPDLQNPVQPEETKYVLHRRFDRMGRLVGDDVMLKLFKSHVMVIGIGGVGSWTAESLARSGVGKITLVDFDEVCITNANRQLHAIQGMVGKKKAEVMGERLRKINPQMVVEVIPAFYNAESSEDILSRNPDYIVDAIDNLTAKAHLLNTCRVRNLKVVTSAGAAARLNPLQIKMADLADTYGDPMAQQLRKILRQKYDWPSKGGFGIQCVFSDEEPINPVELHYDNGEGFKCVCPQNQNNLHSCEHRNVIWGTASFVTGAFGLNIASWIIREVVKS